MRVSIATFVVLFAIAELFQWVKKFELPLPIYILGGVLLAIASNYQPQDNLTVAIDTTSPPLLEEPTSPPPEGSDRA